MRSTFIICAACTLLLSFCAKQGFPPGGPEDRKPPLVIETVPQSGATGVDTGTRPEFRFSETVQPAAVLRSVFITPFPGVDGMRIQLRGRRLKIFFKDDLRENTTYVITLGTEIRDYRNNPIAQSYTLAFSTGDSLDRGRIAGRVFGSADASGISVWAMRTGGMSGQDIRKTQPDYAIQCSKDGSFQFEYMAPGLYRLLAVRDRLSDMVYQAGEDEIGLTYTDVLLGEEAGMSVSGLFFRLSMEDTVPPRPVRAVSENARSLALLWSEPISGSSAGTASIVIRPEKGIADSLPVTDVWLDPMEPRTLYAATGSQAPGAQYRVFVSHVTDQAGNGQTGDADTLTFTAVSGADTARPKLRLSFPVPGEKGMDPACTLRFVFSEAIDSAGFLQGFALNDSGGTAVAGKAFWPAPMEFRFLPADTLEDNNRYTISFSGGNVRDLAGNCAADTTFPFFTMNTDTLTEISGSVFDPDSSAAGAVVVTARKAGSRTLLYTRTLGMPGPYRIDRILPGDYLIEAFRDADGNGRYSPGILLPFHPAERFVVEQDTIRTRSRWPNEGNDLTLPWHTNE